MIKNTLEGFLFSFQQSQEEVNGCVKKMIESVELINPDTDIKIFIDDH